MTDTKVFNTLAVVGVHTGILLEDEMQGIREVMDHLFPGIMTLGTAMMQPTASAYLGSCFPQMAALGKPDEGAHVAFAAKALKVLGPTLHVIGPLDVNKEQFEEAFNLFTKQENCDDN